ncbi:MAG: hypothetical protein LBP35_03310 [Candidatus Ancillula trichonymphae]|nr:hypothetical protein [Candidatus Ancillula trichonymphae]
MDQVLISWYGFNNPLNPLCKRGKDGKTDYPNCTTAQLYPEIRGSTIIVPEDAKNYIGAHIEIHTKRPTLNSLRTRLLTSDYASPGVLFAQDVAEHLSINTSPIRVVHHSPVPVPTPTPTPTAPAVPAPPPTSDAPTVPSEHKQSDGGGKCEHQFFLLIVQMLPKNRCSNFRADLHSHDVSTPVDFFTSRFAFSTKNRGNTVKATFCPFVAHSCPSLPFRGARTSNP